METNRAYAAGLMDGEGSFSIGWNKRQASFGFHVMIANTDLRLMNFLQLNFGGTVSLQSRTVPSARTPCYQWRATAKMVVGFLQAILPYMVGKKEQAEVMLEFLSIRTPSRAIAPPEIRQRRYELREKMLDLNKTRIRNQDATFLTGEEKPLWQGRYVRHEFPVVN